jgi:glycosyltransferase involved in cell wall biosynthesis
MKKRVAFLSRYQNKVNRGVETFVLELAKRISHKFELEIFEGEESDSLEKILKGNFDIVMPLNGGMQSLKVSLARINSHYKLVIGGHSGIGRDDLWNIALCKPDVFIALTEAEYLWAKKWSWGSKVIKIPNGIDLEKFKPNGEKYKIDLPSPIILSVGALEWYKYHERVINAVSLMKEGSLLIVGDGSQKDTLEKLGEQKLSKGRFKIIKAPYQELPKIYRSADVFTLPSWNREAFGIVYLEAMATNLPVVAPDDLSRREIVGDGGVLVDVTDFNQYSKVLESVIKTNFGNKPRTQAEKFSWEKVAHQYEECFNEL